HSRAANFVLGLTEAQMNKSHNYGKVTDNQLRVLEHLGVLRLKWWDYEQNALGRELGKSGLTGADLASEKETTTPVASQREPVGVGELLPRSPDRMRKLANPYTASTSLDDRARSYLQANCAHCHVEAGGGNSLMDLEFTTAREKMRVVGVTPQHHTF